MKVSTIIQPLGIYRKADLDILCGRLRPVRRGPKLGQIDLKWDKSGTFSDHFQYNLAGSIQIESDRPQMEKSWTFKDQFSVHY